MILYITDRNIRVDDADNQISYNSDYIAEFHFDDEWNGKVKTARFVQNGEYVDVVLVDDRCEIPPLKTGFVRIGVFSDSMTSTYADVYFKTSIKDGTGIPTEPPEGIYEQLITLIESGILKGEDGLTPYVGENGNWWLGSEDTGILARGTDGYTPVKGVDYFTESEIRQIQNEVSAEFNAQTEQIQMDISGLKSDLGNKNNLNTDNKTSVVDAINEVNNRFLAPVSDAVKNWLDAHPEATTTVQDHSLTVNKMVVGTLGYVTPEMFGAVGDGQVHIDENGVDTETTAIQDAVDSGEIICGFNKRYKIGSVYINNDVVIKDCVFVIDSSSVRKYVFWLKTGTNVEFNNCKFLTVADKSIDPELGTNVADGSVSNVYFIHASYALKNLIIDNCYFENGLTDINIQGDENRKTNSVVIKNTSSINNIQHLYISHCSDIRIDKSNLIQSQSAKQLSHLIYMSYGDNNILHINDCVFKAVSIYPIHGYHSPNYSVFVDNSYIKSKGNLCALSGNDSEFTCRYSTLVLGEECCTSGGSYQITNKFINCNIEDETVLTTGERDIYFNNCKIKCSNISGHAILSNCYLELSAGADMPINCTGAKLLNSSLIYDSISSNPLRLQGDCLLINCYFENKQTTQFIGYASGENNIIKNCVFKCNATVFYGYSNFTDSNITI